jgi:DNA polymerase-1
MNLQKKTTINITKHYRTLNILIRLFKVIWAEVITKLIKTKLCLFWYWNWTRCLACRVSRDFFLLWEGKDFTYPFRRIRLKQSTRWKIAFFENEKSRKWTEFEIWFKILSNYGINVEGFDTMIAHLINPDMRHNMDILAETYLKYSQSLLKT